MKLSLPASLKAWLLTSILAGSFSPWAHGEVMSRVVWSQIYADMANNMGVYAPGARNVEIIYHYDVGPYTLAVTPDFRSMTDNGAYNLIAPNMVATVGHNGVFSGTFSGRYVGSQSTQSYGGVGVRGNTVFLWDNSGTDFKLDRVNKLVTDAAASPMCTDERIFSSLGGRMIYRAGGGSMMMDDGVRVAGGYAFLAAGITQISGGGYQTETGVLMWSTNGSYQIADISESNLLPFQVAGGDSGSPSFIWNEHTGRYEYLGAAQAIGGSSTYFKGNNRYIAAVQDAVTVKAGLPEDGTTLTWTAAESAGVSASLLKPMLDLCLDDKDNSAVTYDQSGERVLSVGGQASNGDVLRADLYAGTITNGSSSFEYVGVNATVKGNAWQPLDLTSSTWYTSEGSMNASMQDLFFTTNIQFTASAAHYDISVQGNVDTGIGSVEFSRGNLAEASFTLTAASDDSSLHTAGFVIGEGVTVVSRVTGRDGDEWRAIGEGAYRIQGTGNNYIALNIGNGLATVLEREGGYAAYNVLLNTGASLSLRDAGQIGNNLTFGKGGGTLDMNGNDLSWVATENKNAADGNFSIHMLTEEAVIANNRAGSRSTLTFGMSGQQTLAGSFQNGEGAALKVVYNGGGTWTWNGTATRLTGEGSGLEVENGKVILAGTLTRHAGMSSLYTYTYFDNDWHYAQASMNVAVGSGAVFELGSHALLKGNVSVQNGGRFVMRAGVDGKMECVEGWYLPEDVTTESRRALYGLKGNVELASGGQMEAAMGNGTVGEQIYEGSISGAGSFSKTGTVTLILGGGNTWSGAKSVLEGRLHAVGTQALGDCTSNKWQMAENAVLSVSHVTDDTRILEYVDGSSSGLLALDGSTSRLDHQLDFSGHAGVLMGAVEGTQLEYGVEGTAESLRASAGKWWLGGGGGTVRLNFLLEGNNDLYLGSETRSNTGTVILTNADNSFSGNIILGRGMELAFTSLGALGSSRLTLGYGSGLTLQSARDAIAVFKNHVNADAAGILQISGRIEEAVDLGANRNVFLGAAGEGTIAGALAMGGDNYRLGGMGRLTVESLLTGEGRGLIIDGQGNSGGVVTLCRANTLTGEVVVRGSRASSDGGSVTLQAGVDGMISLASRVILQKGAILDAAGHEVILNNLQGEAGSALVNTGDREGVFKLYGNADSTLSLRLDGKMRLEKWSESVLALETSLTDETTFAVAAGRLEASGENRINAGMMEVYGSGTLAAGHKSLGGNSLVMLHGGGTLELISRNPYLTTTFMGEIQVGEGTSACRVDSATCTLDGKLVVNGTLVKKGAGTLAAKSVVEGSGTIDIQEGTLSLKSSLNTVGVAIHVAASAYMQAWGDEPDSIMRSSGQITFENGASLLLGNGSYISTGRLELKGDTNIELLSSGVVGSFQGNIAGAGKLIVTGMNDETHRLEMTGSNTWTGGTEVKKGAWLYVAGAAALGTGSVTLDSSRLGWMESGSGGIHTEASLILLNANALDSGDKHVVLDNRLEGDVSSSFSKFGTGTLELAGNTAEYKGSATVAEGVLKVSRQTILSGDVVVQGRAALEIGASLTLTGRVEFQDGAILKTNGYDTLMLQGDVSMGSVEVDFDAVHDKGGTRSVLIVSSAGGTLANEFLLVGQEKLANTRISTSLRKANGDKDLYLDITGNSTTVTWKGSTLEGQTFSMKTVDETHISTALTEDDHMMYSQDKLVFAQASAGGGESHTVQLGQDGLLASGILVRGDDHYTLSGGPLRGDCSLTKTGSGTLTLTASSSYTGGSSLEGGLVVATGNTVFGTGAVRVEKGAVLQLGTGALGEAQLQLNGGRLKMEAGVLNGASIVEVNEDSVVEFLSDGNSSQKMNVSAGKSVTLALGSQSVTWNGALLGKGTLVKEGGGKLMLDSAFVSNEAKLCVKQGTLQLGTSKTTPPAMGGGLIRVEKDAVLQLMSNRVVYSNQLEFADGACFKALDGGGGGTPTNPTYLLAGDVRLEGGLNIRLNWDKVTSFSGVVSDGASGAGRLHIAREGGSGVSQIVLAGRNTFSGGVTMEGSGIQLLVTNRSALGSGDLLLNKGELVWYEYAGGFDAEIVLGADAGLRVDKAIWGNMVVMDSRISGDKLHKTGNGTLKITGELAHTGETAVSGGELILDRGSIVTRLTGNVSTGKEGGSGALRFYSDAVIERGHLGGYGEVDIAAGVHVTLHSSLDNVAPAEEARKYSASRMTGAGTLELAENVLAFDADAVSVDPKIRLNRGTISLRGAASLNNGMEVNADAGIHFSSKTASLHSSIDVRAGASVTLTGEVNAADNATLTGGVLAYAEITETKFVVANGGHLSLEGNFLLNLSSVQFDTGMLLPQSEPATAFSLPGLQGAIGETALFEKQQVSFDIYLASGLRADERWEQASFTLDSSGPSWLTEAALSEVQYLEGKAFVTVSGVLKEVAPVPEPSSGVLTLFGVGVLIARRRRRRA